MFVLLARIILLFAALSLCSPARSLSDAAPSAQTVTLHWGIREGLPHPIIKAIVQTPDGYVWLGTQEGLVRFDGFRFTVFTTRNAPGLVSNNIYDLKLDGSGTVWIHANMAVSCYRHGVFTDMSAGLPPKARITKIGIGGDGKFYALGANLYHAAGDALLPSKAYASITDNRTDCQAGRDGTFWVGTDQGSLYEIQDDQAVRLATAAQLGKGNVGIACGPAGTVWISAAKGLFRLRGGKLAHLAATASTKGFAVAGGKDTGSPAIVRDCDGAVWACDGTTLFVYRNGVFVSLRHTPGAPAVCTRIGVDGDGHFFALGPPPAKPAPPKDEVILYRADQGRFSHLPLPGGILPLWSFPVCLDQNNNNDLWVGTRQGLEFHHAALCRTYTAQDGLPAAGAGTLYPASDGSVWMGTQGEGLWREANGKFGPVPAPELPHAPVSSFAHDPQGNVWVSAGDDTFLLHNGHLTPFSKICKSLGKSIPTIYSLAWGPSGAWAAATSKGLLHRVHGRYVYTDTEHNPVLSGTRCRLQIDSRGRVWVMGALGFTCFDGDKVTNYGPDQGLARVPVIAYCEAHDGTLWFGLWGGGLVRWKDGKVTTITYRSGLLSDMIYGIVEDDYGSLWIGSGRGIFRVSSEELNDAADGTSQTLTCRPYGLADGAAGGEVVPDLQSSGCKDRDGQIWFSCLNGLIRIDPRPLSSASLPVLIESMTIDGIHYPQAQGVTTPPGGGQLEVQYTAINDTTPDQMKFRYKLEGYDDEWREVGDRRTAFYTKLPPGTYSLLVQATDGEGLWNGKPARVTLTLQPHFTETLWFTLGRYALLALLVFAAVLVRVRQLKKHTRELERKVGERTEQLEQAHEEALAQNDQLQEMQTEMEAQNEELQENQAELEAQNEELSATQAELAAQYEEMQQIKEDLRLKNIVLEASNSRLADLATTDGLTGLRNHRSFQERLEQEWVSAVRYQTPLSVLLMDVDEFKQYNDTYGHPAGDEVLRQVGQTLQECARDSDFVARYGGEEFVVILPHTDAAGACALAERYRAAIADAGWPLRAITVSIGAAGLSLTTRNQAALLEQADQALYQSKKQGRNRVARWVGDAENSPREESLSPA